MYIAMGRVWPQIIQKTRNYSIKKRKYLLFSSVLCNLYTLWELCFIKLVINTFCVNTVLSSEQAKSARSASLCYDFRCFHVEVSVKSLCTAGLVYRSLCMQVDDTDDRALRKYYVPGKQKKCLVFCEVNELNRLTVQGREQKSRAREMGNSRRQEERCR